MDRIFRRAKGSPTVLTEAEIMREIAKWKSETWQKWKSR
jgi:hypothetical protein